jgi:hypothetical protein
MWQPRIKMGWIDSGMADWPNPLSTERVFHGSSRDCANGTLAQVEQSRKPFIYKDIGGQ